MADDNEDVRVYCVRNSIAKGPEEHLDCPYCYGKKEVVEGGERKFFCDYDPAKDPTTFGFPVEIGRHRGA